MKSKSRKKIIFASIVVFACMLFSFASCNRDLVDFNYTYSAIHLYETGKCYDIAGWTDYADGEQLQVRLKNGGTVLVSSYSCMLVNGKCPICDK